METANQNGAGEHTGVLFLDVHIRRFDGSYERGLFSFMVKVHSYDKAKSPKPPFPPIYLHHGEGFQEWQATLSCLDFLSEAVGKNSLRRKLAAWSHVVLSDKDVDDRKHLLTSGNRENYQLHGKIYYKRRNGVRVTTLYDFRSPSDWLNQPRSFNNELPRPPIRQVVMPEPEMDEELPF